MKKLLISFFSLAVFFLGATNVAAADYSVSNQSELETAISSATPGQTIEITSDFNVGNRIDINTPLTIDGSGYTISPTFAKTDNSNNATFGIFGSDVTIQNLTIDGTNGTNLHGINIYVAENIFLDNIVVSNNDRAAVVVNGSTVTVNNITTSGNGWGGINVDQGSGVVTPAILTVNGYSSHDEDTHIWLDNITKDVQLLIL